MAMNWCDDWGTISPRGRQRQLGGHRRQRGSRPTWGVPAEQTYSTDCLPYYFVKSGTGSQGQRVSAVYQPFAFATIFATERVLLCPEHTYGDHRSMVIANRRIDWLPLTHPGNRTPAWRARHTQWTT